MSKKNGDVVCAFAAQIAELKIKTTVVGDKEGRLILLFNAHDLDLINKINALYEKADRLIAVALATGPIE